MNQPTQTIDIRRDLVALLPRLRRFALTLADTPQDADRLVREVCARAIQKSHHWKGEGRIESWLFSLMRAAWSDEIKKRRKTQPSSTAKAKGADSAAGMATTAASDRILLSLPAGLASVFLLVDVEAFAYGEAAAILGIPEQAFAERLCSARLKLSEIAPEASERRA
jgi:RNA polymerase sigma-70 factor (ECF subfamily)